MGSALAAVYSVPLDKLRSLPGSRRKKLARMIARDFIGRDDIDEMFAEHDPPNTLYAAAQQILNGEPLRDDLGSLYGYAVEGLCWSIGTTFYLPIEFPTIEHFDQFLTRVGAPVRLHDLAFAGMPLAVPPGDFPFAGSWSPERVITAAAFFDGVSTDGEDRYIQAGARESRRWLAEAMKHETDALVGFYY